MDIIAISKNIKFPYTSSFTSFPYVTTKLMNSNNYSITMSFIPSNKDYYS